MPTETEFEQDPAAVAGRTLLEERLARRTSAELDAFWEAVQRCYASAAEEDDGEDR